MIVFLCNSHFLLWRIIRNTYYNIIDIHNNSINVNYKIHVHIIWLFLSLYITLLYNNLTGFWSFQESLCCGRCFILISRQLCCFSSRLNLNQNCICKNHYLECSLKNFELKLYICTLFTII